MVVGIRIVAADGREMAGVLALHVFWARCRAIQSPWNTPRMLLVSGVECVPGQKGDSELTSIMHRPEPNNTQGLDGLTFLATRTACETRRDAALA